MKRRARRVFESLGLFRLCRQAFFDLDRLVRADTRYGCGEDRYQLMGKIEERLFVVVYTPRQDAIGIISARKANQREIKRYEDRTHDN